MPVFPLDEHLIFPHPVLRDPDGLMAYGGDLSPERLLLAYRWGIFPWYQEDQPILWWWLAPRLVLKPGEVHISHTVERYIRQKRYKVTINKDFIGVINNCRTIRRKGQQHTWIIPEMVKAYTDLHHLGHAHAIEVSDEDGLAGGVYGIALGKIFFGESMFSIKPNASKIAFIHLAQHLSSLGFLWIDCQQDTPHMRTLGGQLMEENDFLQVLRDNQKFITDGAVVF